MGKLHYKASEIMPRDTLRSWSFSSLPQLGTKTGTPNSNRPVVLTNTQTPQCMVCGSPKPYNFTEWLEPAQLRSRMQRVHAYAGLCRLSASKSRTDGQDLTPPEPPSSQEINTFLPSTVRNNNISMFLCAAFLSSLFVHIFTIIQ